jgi:hypothetical protein
MPFIESLMHTEMLPYTKPRQTILKRNSEACTTKVVQHPNPLQETDPRIKNPEIPEKAITKKAVAVFFEKISKKMPKTYI